MRGMVAAVALVCLAVPAFAAGLTQDEATKQVNDIGSTFQAAYNKHDAAGLANLFTTDAVFVLGSGKVLKSQEEIKEFYVKYFDGPGKTVSDFTTSVDEIRPLGDSAWAIGHTSVNKVDTHWGATYRQDEGKLRVDMLIVGVTAGSGATPQK
jgi:uncharacterized protein (TIGR02246 family)